MYIIGLFILLIIIILGILLTDPHTHIVQKHFFWLMFVSFCAAISTNTYDVC